MENKSLVGFRKFVCMQYFAILLMCFSGQSFADVSYSLPQDVSGLYPAPGSGDPKYSDDMSDIISEYLEQSLQRDQIKYTSFSVTLNSDKNPGYDVNIVTSDPKAELYKNIHPKWLDENHAALSSSGITECKAIGPACWNPLHEKEGIKWDPFLPLGLPMVSQKALMLLHYPPYVSLEKYHDYLKNETIWRWERLLRTAGVEKGNESLYETIVDIIPVAAPGSGQSAYLPTLMASYFFDYESDDPEKNRPYVTAMTELLVDPPTNPSESHTRPIIVFGDQAKSYWIAKYQYALPKDKKWKPKTLYTSSLKLDPEANKLTPFVFANHPIKAVYYKCDTNPTIIQMVQEDLATACIAKTFGNKPDADPDGTKTACVDQFDYAAGKNVKNICINATVDMMSWSDKDQCNDSPDVQQCIWDLAAVACGKIKNKVCP